MKDNQVLVRLNDKQNESLEQFAEDRQYNKSEAARKVLVSRLVGDGYLEEGVLLSDGGLQSGIQENQETIEYIQVISVWLAVSIIWILLENMFALPSWFIIPTGFILIIGILYSGLQYYFNNND